MIRPAQGGVGQGFSTSHPAVDIGGAEYFGTPIVAPFSGTITAAGQMGSGTNDAGLAIDVTSDDGTRRTRLAHNDRILVTVGQRVSQGEQIGTQGYTGYTQPDNTINGTHCHWVLWINGVRVDPLDYVTNEGGDMQEEIDKLWKALDVANKRNDEQADQIDKVYKALDAANKRLDKLEALGETGGLDLSTLRIVKQ